ncbi:MAG: HAMP domain-containing protein, partial [Ottowia sp.]|nr:HAMP domain-containing protein [Ottowia sp.]
ALLYSDSIERISLIKTIDAQEKVRILLRESGDRYELFDDNPMERRLSREVLAHMPEGTIVARSVNGQEGLWISFEIGGDGYWLLMDLARAGFALRSRTWLVWLLLLAAFTIAGAALLTHRINQPLQHLSTAFARVRAGDYSTKLDEQTHTVEVRDVNISFNRMAEQLSLVEQDRAQMLAGISHDLRTPLARLRLELEMSVHDEEARQHMGEDIEQVDAIINKFLDYARPGAVLLQALQLERLVHTCAAPFMARDDMLLRINIPSELHVLCDEVDFSRVLSNLLENARRYGKTPGEDISHVRIAAFADGEWVTLRVQDHGPGVPEELLSQITRPFFRADSARTAAKCTGLGLSIVARTVEGMDGRMQVANAPSGGLMVIVQLHYASAPKTTLPAPL